MIDGNFSSGFSTFEACFSLLSQELDHITGIASLQKLVRTTIFERNWVEFEILIASLDELSEEFRELEAERARIFAGIIPVDDTAEEIAAISEDASDLSEELATEMEDFRESRRFYQFIAGFPEFQRRKVSETYREIKLGILKIRLESDSLTGYLREAQGIADDFLDAAFPARKQKTYSRRGYKIESDMTRMILDQEC